MRNEGKERQSRVIGREINHMLKVYHPKCPFCNAGKNEDGTVFSLCEGLGYVVKRTKNNNAIQQYDKRRGV